MNKQEFEIVRLDVSRKKDRELFVDLPFILAREHESWQPGVRFYYHQLLHPQKNPFWQQTEAAFYVLKKDHVVAGRVGVIRPGYLKELSQAALLIFPDFIEDAAVAQALLQKAEEQAVSWNARQLAGPFNPNIHYDVGIQYQGFASRNSVFMGYQPPYYAACFEALGYQKLYDFSAWELYQRSFPQNGILHDMADRVLCNSNISIRELDMDRFSKELSLFYQLYCGSFADHWGFSCPRWEEFRFLAGDMKYLLKGKMGLVAEYKNEPVGFVLGIPDIYSIINKGYGGKLTPAAIVSLLWKYRKIRTVRVMIAGILPPYRSLGIHIPLFRQIAVNIFELGYTGGEIAWVMDDNAPMNRVLPLLGAQRTKGYRVYLKQLEPDP